MVRSRYLKLSEMKSRAAANGALDEDDDYEPDYPVANREQVLNHLDQIGRTQQEMALGPYNLPKPPPLTTETAVNLSQNAVTRVFATLNELDGHAPVKSNQRGFHRLAAMNHDRQGWVTILTRLATRTSVGGVRTGRFAAGSSSTIQSS